MFPNYNPLAVDPPALTCEERSESHPPSRQCGPLPGSILRIFIPPGAVINLLNLIEVDSPSGVCLIVRLPFLGGGAGGTNLQSIISSVQAAGGTVEFS